MTSFMAAGGSGRSTSVIPAVPAAWSVTTIAFMGIVSSVICLLHQLRRRQFRKYVPRSLAVGIRHRRTLHRSSTQVVKPCLVAFQTGHPAQTKARASADCEIRYSDAAWRGLLLVSRTRPNARNAEESIAMRLINQNRTGQPWVKPGNNGCASSGHMRRYREPFPVLLRPAIGVAPVRLLSVRRGVTERRMDDGEVAHDADLYIMRLQILDRHRLRGLLKEGGAVDQRFVGI